MRDHEVVDRFVKHLCGLGHPGLVVDRRPDVDNRQSRDIDATAGPFAIEHTSIDTVFDQRAATDRFRKVTRPILQQLSGTLPFRLKIIFGYNAICVGQDWAAIREALHRWITNESSRLADGIHVLNGIPGIPFSLHVIKAGDRAPRLLFGRVEPRESTLPNRPEQIRRRAAKLARYQAPGMMTILLIESNDLALMNPCKLLDAIREAQPSGLPCGVDQVWYADTSVPTAIEFIDLSAQLLHGVVRKAPRDEPAAHWVG